MGRIAANIHRAGKLSGKKILVVDDVKDIHVLMRFLLESIDAEPLSAENAQEAFDMVLKHRPDAVLLDMQLPDADGDEVATRIRGAGYNGPIVAMTGEAVRSKSGRCEYAGHLVKPVQVDRLLELLASLF